MQHQHAGLGATSVGKFMAALIRFHSQQDAAQWRGLGSARPAPRLQGNADALPSQVCSHTDSLAGNDRVKISVTPEGTRPVPAPWPCCGREMGHYPVQLAGQDGSPAAWAGMRCLCLLPLPLHSFPAARSVGWLPQQQLKPSARIQHVLPSLQRGGCACRGRLHCSS